MPEPSLTTVETRTQPRVRGNDWRSLHRPEIGEWQPTLTVSVVIPAYRAESTLPCVLAALAAQTYPCELLEVIVVDDGSDPPLQLPPLRPERTRLLTTDGSWGPANARHVGAMAASGDVLHWLDADILLHRDEVEAQLRWHHMIDHAVVLGTKTFVDVGPGLPDPAQAHAAVREGRTAELFADRWTSPHDWVEEHLQRTHGLTSSPTTSFLVHVGACASVSRAMYAESGGLDESLRRGEDVELGYRLSQLGALFVPDDEARSWHLGPSALMQQHDDVRRYNRPFVTDRIPTVRHWRTKGRSYTVPWVEVVVDASAATFEQVRHSVAGALTGSASDVVVLVTGPWHRLSDDRHDVLVDPARDLRMLQAEYAGEARVRFVEEAPESAFPAPYRLRLPAGWSPGRDSVRRLAVEMARRDRGLVSLLMPDGAVARLERTSAFHRAVRLGGPADDVDDVVDEVSGTWWFEAVEEGFTLHAGHDNDPASSPDPAPVGPAGAPRRGAARRESLGRQTVAPAPPVDRAVRRLRRVAGRALRRVRRG
jgi:glycosyltransferase involved in cell wall biosynthesis